MLPTTFFSMNSPDSIESTIVGILKENDKISYSVDEQKYKLKFKLNLGQVPDLENVYDFLEI